MHVYHTRIYAYQSRSMANKKTILFMIMKYIYGIIIIILILNRYLQIILKISISIYKLIDCSYLNLFCSILLILLSVIEKGTNLHKLYERKKELSPLQ